MTKPASPAPAAGTQPADPKPKAAKAQTLFVLDTTATAVPGFQTRTHELIINGMVKSFTFKYDEKLELPDAIAMRFVAIPAFVVTDAAGKRYQPPPTEPGTDGKLRDNEIIARFDELSTDALAVRARQLPGAETLKGKVTRDTLIAFLKDATLRRRAAQTVPDPDNDPVAEADEGNGDDFVVEASESDTAKLFSDVE